MASERISLILPTRGRPKFVERLFRSLTQLTAHLDLIEVILYVDEDDTASHHLDSQYFSVKRIIGPKLSMGEYNTSCLRVSSGEIIILVNDDIVIRTKDWDVRVRSVHSQCKDQIYLAYPNDLFKKSKFCTFPILSRRTCDLLVEPFPGAYKRYFIDPHLFDIFKRLKHAGYARIFYCRKIVFEHLHFRVGKAACDETYQHGKEGRFDDDQTFIDLIKMRSNSAKRLISVIDKRTFGESEFRYKQNKNPSNLVQAIRLFTHNFLLDKELPFGWRLFLWYYFIGRYLAAKGFLKPFVSGRT